MKYQELAIVTRREAPAHARTQGEALLIRAGYLSPSHKLTQLGQLAISKAQTARGSLTDIASQAGLATIRLGDGRLASRIPSGDTEVLECPICGYVDEADLARARKVPLPQAQPLPLRKVATPNCNTIQALADLLGIEEAQTGKAMMYTRTSDGKLVFVMIRGDMQVSERKLVGALGSFRPASLDEMSQSGAVAGYASPIGLRDAFVVIDDLIPASANLAIGANETGFHFLNANCGRDFRAQVVQDVTLARAGDPCPSCGTKLASGRAIVLSDASGPRPVSVLLASAEACHDDKGLRLPRQLAPFDVYLVQLASKELDLHVLSEDVCHDLEAAGALVLWDDRDERAGVKFNDADLIGCPVRLTIGEKNARSGMVELKRRDQGQIHTVTLTEARDRVLALLGNAND